MPFDTYGVRMNISIKAKSSSGDSFYTVDFFVKEDVLSVLCDCPAGEWGKFCKHKWQLLNGDQDMLADPEQAEKLLPITKLAAEKGVGNLYKDVEDLEAQKKALTKDQKKAKNALKKTLSKKATLDEVEFAAANEPVSEIDLRIAYISYLMAKEKEIVENKLKNGF